jgi:hypothetical protein
MMRVKQGRNELFRCALCPKEGKGFYAFSKEDMVEHIKAWHAPGKIRREYEGTLKRLGRGRGKRGKGRDKTRDKAKEAI